MKNRVVSIYILAGRLAEITQRYLINGNIQRVKKCMEITERLLKTGNNEAKSVMSGIINSVSSFMELRHWSTSALFPTELKTAYVKQINAALV